MTSNDEKHLKNSAIFELPKRTKNLVKMLHYCLLVQTKLDTYSSLE